MNLKILPAIFTVTQVTQATPESSSLKIVSPGWWPSWVWYLAEAPALSAVACNSVPALTLLSGPPHPKKTFEPLQRREALKELVEHVSNPPLMAYPDFSKTFTLHTDASKDGLGAVLYQNHDEIMRVIAYTSLALLPTVKKYHLHAGKLEFLALKWAVTEQFCDYLYHSP